MKLPKVFLQEHFVKLPLVELRLTGRPKAAVPTCSYPDVRLHVFISTCLSPQVRPYMFVPTYVGNVSGLEQTGGFLGSTVV